MPTHSARILGSGPQPAALAAGGPVRPSALRDMEPAIRQGLLILGIFIAVAGLAWVGLGAAMRFLMPPCGLACAVWYRRRSPWLYLTATLWFWTLTPFIRRVIDYRTGFSAMDIVLVTPDIMALVMLPELLRSRTLWRRPQTLAVLLMLMPAAYGLGVSLVQGQVVPGAVASADWFTPLIYFLFVLENIPRIDQAEPHLRGFVALNSLVLAAYSLSQFFNPPVWDVAWALSSGMLHGSETEAQTIHVFGTLNSNGEQAQWLAALILLSLHFRTRLMPFVLPLLCALLTLTYVRSITVGALVAFMIATFLNPRQMTAGLAGMALAVTLISVCLVTFNPKVSDLVINRLSSLSNLKDDDSAIRRSQIWASMPAYVDEHPLGMGIGAIGRGAAVTGDPFFVNVDAGPLAVYLSLGWVGGTIYLLGMLTALAQAFTVAVRVRSSVVLSCMAAMICSAAEFLMANIYGFGGVILWCSVGLIFAYGTTPLRPGMILPRVSHPRRTEGRGLASGAGQPG